MNQNSQIAAHTQPHRRDVLKWGSVSALAAAAVPGKSLMGDESKDGPWLRKTLKINMIKTKGGLVDKFRMAKDAGFEGVELNTPGINIDEAKKAAAETGLIIDGTVGGYHWNQTHTNPKKEVRDAALSKLKQGLRETAAVGGESMLLVPGHGRDGSAAEVYERALAAITEALPVAEKVGVQILIENVWNHFLYDHGGGNDQSAEPLAKFIDAFGSPWVGVQFDLGNHWKYGDVATWVRTLDHRIKKLDIKGFSRAENKFTKITEGDIDWPSVEKALRDIKFTGWVAAEVGGGDLERLKEVALHLEEALNCSKSVTG
ncbi:MAG: sugar phosphate isomerase/epimerase family protein [Planctomycetota bacterium]